MKTTMRLFLLLCTVFMASQPVLAQNDEDTRNKVVIITDDGDRQLITDEISVIRFDGPKVTVVQPWGETVFDRTLRSLTFLRPLPGTLRLTVNLSKDNDASATRGHGIDDDGFLTSTWSSTDRIYVYANATTTTPIGTLEPVTYGTTVSAMTGDITADELSSGQTIYLSTQPRPHSYAAQSGEIGSSSLFYLTAEPTITITGANASVSDATFEMAQAVVRFSLLKNTNGKALNVYGLTIEGGSETITVTPNQSNPPAQVYVGMPENSTSTTYHLTGVDDDDREWTGTVTAATWAGKYYRANVTMTRTKLTPTVTAPTAKSLTYNGSARALVNAGSTTGGTLYYKSTTTNTAPAIDATGWSTSIPTGTTATTYYVWTKVIGNEDYNDVGVSATPVVVTIGKKALTITANAQTIAYGTSIATGTAQVTPSGLVAGDGLTSITLTPSGSSVTTNGTITPSAAKTTKGIGNYSVTYTAGNLTITAVPASVSTAPAAVGDELTYSGSAQTLFSVGTATGGTMMYKVTTDNTMPASTADFNTTIEEGTNAGTYYLWYYVAGDTNHDDTEISATNISKTIGKKAPAASDFNYTAPTSLVYDGNAKSASVAVREGITGMGTVSVHHYMEGGIVESPTGVGTYNVKITVDEGDNYSTASSELTDDSWTFTIGNATMTGITATAYSAAYDGNAHGITLNNVPDGATVTYGTTEGTYDLTVAPTYTDVAAERTVYYKVSKTNYADFTGSSTVTITQAPNAFTTQPSIMGWTYGESANAPTGGVASFGTGTITYKYCATEDGEYGTYDAIVNGQAGTWYMKGFVEATTNYAAATSEAVSFTISAAAMAGITATAYSAAYDGNAHGITLNNVPDGATVTYGETEGTYDLTVAPTYTDVAAERTVYYKVSKTNYADFTGSSTVTITQASNSFTTQPTITGWTYGQSANAPTGGVASFGTSTITYKYCATENGEYGTYDAIVNGQAGTWYVKGFVEATTNYAAATSNAVSFTISAAAMAGITATAYSAAYDGNAHGITLNNVPDGATVTYGETDGTYDLTVAPTYTDVAAKRTVYYKVSKTNYADVTGSSTVTITQKPVTITANAQTVDYGTSITQETNQVTIGSLCNGHSLTSITFTQSTTDATTSGTITLSVATIKDGSNNDVTSNYNITYSPGSLTINKVPATLTCSTDALSFTALQGANSTVTKTGVSCTGGTISVSSGTEANCTVSYSEGTITVRRVNTAAFTDTEITVSVTPDANHTAPSSVTFSVSAVAALPAGELPGKFTINAGGGQVSFSQGNLQYQASTQTWRFAPNQYDMIGSDNANISDSYTGWIDLLGWGTGNNPTNSSESNGDYSTCTDWGVNAISNGGNTADMWRTLSKDEWVYLFANHTKGWSNVNGVYGYVIRPDGVSTAVAASYTASEWAVEEAAGSVFLPAAGSRGGTSVGGVGAWGDYWSSTHYNSNDAYYLYFNSSQPYPSNNTGRFGGRSVRLVYETPFQGAGTESDPYLISSEADWIILANKVNSGNSFTGKFFRQTANINVTTMVGNSSDSKPFSGTYDGDGKTLNLSLNTSTPHTAPFRLIANATIKNVVTTGTVHSTDNHPSGLVGTTDGTCTIQNCRVGANVGGAQHSGGIVGHSMHANIYIIGCVYSGTLSPASGQLTGGIIGWGGDGGGHTMTISNCLFAGTVVGSTTFHPVGIVQTTNNTRTVSNTYYTVAHNMSDENTHGNSFVNGLSYKGKFARSITAGTGVTVARTGATAVYDVSGITSYGTGILYNGVLYAGDGEAVSLSLSHGAAPSGFTFGQYTVSGGGTLANPTSNSPTLTMTDADQTINAQWSELITYKAPTLRTGLTFNGNQNNVSGSAQNLVNAGSVSHGTIYYSIDGGSNWNTSVPYATNAGTYTIHYKVVPYTGYSGGVGSTSLGSTTIAKANGWVTLTSYSSSGWNTIGKKDVTIYFTHHGGELSISLSGTNMGDKIQVNRTSEMVNISKRKASDKGYGTVTITSAATANYNAASATYTCNQ